MPEDSNAQPPAAEPNTQQSFKNSVNGQYVQPSQEFTSEIRLNPETLPPGVAQQTVPGVVSPTTKPTVAPQIKELATYDNKQKRRLPIILAGLAVLVLAGMSGFVVLAHKDKATQSSGKPSSSKAKTADLSANGNLASINTAGWQKHSDSTIKVSFKYPSSIPVAHSRVEAHPSTSLPSDLIQHEVYADAEIIATSSSGIVTPLSTSNLIDIVTYAPGSFNDTRGYGGDDKSSRYTRTTKPMTINGITGTCIYSTFKFDSKHIDKDYNCKFRKGTLVYEISGGPKAYDVDSFPGIDLWSISQKVLETFEFTN